jgi:hypothetical protein
MKTFIAQNPNTSTGYELRIVHENGEVECKHIEKLTKDGKSYILPENPSNRQYWAVSRTKDGVELTYKETKTFGPKTSDGKPTVKKVDSIEQYLTEDELKVWNELKEKATARMSIAKAKAMAEAAQAEYERLLKEAQA